MVDEGLLSYELAHQSLEHLTVARAVYYLTYIFDCGTHEICVAGQSTTPCDVALDSYVSSLQADRLIIHFWGGPPDEEDWYKGSLLTMLIDRLFYCVASGYTDVVEKFLEVLNGSSRKTRSFESEDYCYS